MKKIIAFVCWAEVLFMWFCAGCQFINPAETYKLLAIPVLLFPLSVFIVLITGLVCLFVARKQALILVLGLLVCFNSIRDYCPVNLPQEPPTEHFIKAMSYNTLSLGNFEKNDSGEFKVARYILSENPDIVCLQEAGFRSTEDQECMVNTMKENGYNYQWNALGNSVIGLASKYPIAKHEYLCMSTGNGAIAYYLTPRPNDTIIVVNAHLESMHLSSEDRGQYHAIVKHLNKANQIGGKRTILSKIANYGCLRAMQGDTIAHFIDRHAGQKMLVMGDFNDTPISFAHHQICSRLTDAYRTSGNGIGRSFNKDAIIVRIDNIFCSSHWTPMCARVHQDILYSDHYPITCYLKENQEK